MEFKGKDILIIGRSYSAEDIGSQCYKYGAKSITSSYRSKPMGFKWPENWKEVPLLQKVVGKTAHFKDGTTKDVDAIILCTGYLHSFPFLTDDLKLKTATACGRWTSMRASSGRRIRSCSISACRTSSTLQHVRRASLVRARRHHGPHQAALRQGDGRAQRQVARARGNAGRRRADDLVPGRLHQGTDGADRLSGFDVEAVNQTFMEWEHHKGEDIMSFRDHAYRSLMTGTMAPLHHTPWLQALDDSMESISRSRGWRRNSRRASDYPNLARAFAVQALNSGRRRCR